MNLQVNYSAYQSYKDLPALAGLATIEEAARPCLSIEECVTRLKRFHYAFVRLHEIFNARITAEPIYELKTGFSHHAYLCAEHAQAIRDRVGEMREPPLGLEKISDRNLQIFFDEILAAPTTDELLVGLYQKALPRLDAAIEHYLQQTNPVADAPSRRVCKFARLEIGEMIDFGAKCIAHLVNLTRQLELNDPLDHLADCLEAAGGIDGTEPSSKDKIERRNSTTPYKYDPVPKRDERFQDLYNQGVNPEAFIYSEDFDPKSKCLMMLYKRIRELDVPEMMASIIHETKDKPWEYYRDMTRQLWDEARHAMLGEVGFVSLGIDWTQARITHNWSLRLNTECNPLERHAVLFFIEQGLMTKTGKRYEWELGVESGIPIMATIQDFDWADEVLHAQIGRQWLVPEFGTLQETLQYGDDCWSRILSNWQQVKEDGLTKHENWWPAIYQQACQTWGISPDRKVLKYDVTYEDQRADLKSVSGSA
ncbi:MAG: hypothetical protein ACFCD0_22385 [Gemmataceae bacterium]